MNPVRNNIYVEGDYYSKNPTWGQEDSAWKADLVLSLITKNHLQPKHIAEVGCGAGMILNQLSLLTPESTSFCGYDISPQAIALAQKNETERIHFQCVDFATTDLPRPDLLLVIDVVEHVQDYLQFLSQVRVKSDYFIFHIPLDLSCRTIFKSHVILQQRRDVGHLHYFTRDHVNWILEDAGYKIINWTYTFSETDRNKPSSIKGFTKKLARRISYFISKELSVKLWGGYSVMLLCSSHE